MADVNNKSDFVPISDMTEDEIFCLEFLSRIGLEPRGILRGHVGGIGVWETDHIKAEAPQ